MSRGFVLIVALTLMVGCGSATVAKAPRDITLESGEVPAGFRLTIDQENTIQDIAGQFADSADSEEKLRQNGFMGSWRRDYERDAPSGATFIRTGATVYRESAGATFGVTANASEQPRKVRGAVKLTSLERIGDESHAFEYPEFFGGRELTTYTIYFRYLNVSNVLIVTGPVGTHDPTLAVDLAKRQVAKAR
jgi:hypothetical protein